MARSFEEDDKDGKDKKKEQPKPKNNGCCASEADGAWGGPLPELPPPPEVIQDEADEGRHLYMDFVRTELNRNGLRDACLTDNTDDESGVSPEKLLEWVRAGRELRQLADAFSRSNEREAVRKKAAGVPVDTLDVEYFMHLLQELFEGGEITRERIIVLFFFCADVAIQALRMGLHRTFHRLLDWSIKYISTQVASWVHSCGGWGVVLRSSLNVAYQLSACCAFLAVVAACAVYIRRNL